MSVKMDRMRCRHSLFAGDFLDVASVDDKVHEATIPGVVCVVDRCLIDIVEVAVIVDVEDAGAGVVEEERFVC